MLSMKVALVLLSVADLDEKYRCECVLLSTLALYPHTDVYAIMVVNTMGIRLFSTKNITSTFFNIAGHATPHHYPFISRDIANKKYYLFNELSGGRG